MYEEYAANALQMLSNVQHKTLINCCKEFGISVKWMEGYSSAEGYAAVIDGNAFIFLKRQHLKARVKDALAHELAHILLGHLGDWREIGGRALPKEQQEDEACRFVQLLQKSGW